MLLPCGPHLTSGALFGDNRPQFNSFTQMFGEWDPGPTPQKNYANMMGEVA